jgi:acyl carrier protein
VAGELLIGGDGVTRGYLNRPELTSKSFIPDIFGNDPHRLLYKTGDLACLLADGNLKIFGRIDHQVKLRGYRIELGEIETILTSFILIDKAVVLVREDEPGDKRLVAYFTLKDDQEYSQNELRNYMRLKLPEYMVPSFFVKLTEMPLTLNGKIDRKALPQPEQKRSDLEQEFVPPQNETENILSEAWIKVLKIDRVGIHDNFFELGGNSLLIVQLAGRLKNEYAIDIPVVKCFQYPTIHACAAYIDNSQSQLQPSENVLKKAQLQRKAMAAQKLIKGRKNHRRTMSAS